MPMLMTLRIGLPVWPVQAPERTRSANARHPVEHLVDLLDDVDAVDHERALARHPQRDVEHGAVLGDVDVLAAEHGLAPLRPARTPRPGRRAGAMRLVGDPVLGVVEEEPGRLGGQPLAAAGVLGEQVAKVPLADLGVVALQRRSTRRAPAARSCGSGRSVPGVGALDQRVGLGRPPGPGLIRVHRGRVVQDRVDHLPGGRARRPPARRASGRRASRRPAAARRAASRRGGGGGPAARRPRPPAPRPGASPAPAGRSRRRG